MENSLHTPHSRVVTMPKKHVGPPVETESYLNKWADQKVS
jgi:hypothetical protein